MIATRIFLAATLMAAAPIGAQPERAGAELPPPVQRALERVAKGEPIKTINRRVIDGRTVYDVELEREDALNPRFRITDEGVIVAGGASAPREGANAPRPDVGREPGIVTTFDAALSVGELPARVRETINKESKGREVADIDRESWQGSVVYEVEFKEAGRNPQLHIGEDGRIIVAEPSAAGRIGSTIRSLFMGTQVEDTPPAVQETIRREARDRAIRDIDVEKRDGLRIYDVEIDEVRSVFHIHVAEDGRILHDTRPEASTGQRE